MNRRPAAAAGPMSPEPADDPFPELRHSFLLETRREPPLYPDPAGDRPPGLKAAPRQSRLLVFGNSQQSPPSSNMPIESPRSDTRTVEKAAKSRLHDRIQGVGGNCWETQISGFKIPPDYAQSSACDLGSMEMRAQARESVIPAKAGIHFKHESLWIPASAGMTD